MEDFFVGEKKFPRYILNVDLRYNRISHIHIPPKRWWSSKQEFMINIEENPIKCDCNLYHFIRFINYNDQRQKWNVRLKADDVICPNNVPITDLQYQLYQCPYEVDEKSLPLTDPCAPGGICECWLRPHDQTLIMDCSDRNLTELPDIINAKNVTRLELSLQRNNYKEFPSIVNLEFSKIKLNLSSNQISSLNKNVLSPNISVIFFPIIVFQIFINNFYLGS